jgi:hypothetical protein
MALDTTLLFFLGSSFSSFAFDNRHKQWPIFETTNKMKSIKVVLQQSFIEHLHGSSA